MSKAIGRAILTINAGSSSLKFAFFASGDTLSRTFHGHIARIGSPDAVMTVQDAGKQHWSQPIIAPDHAAAAHTLVDWIDKRHDTAELMAVGHRVVHGGPKFCEPQRLTPDTINALRGIGAFDPQHLPQELLLIEALQQRYRDIPQFACFDTAFFHNLPRVAQMLPIPRRYEARGVRRYGFHGLSYSFLMDELARLTGADTARGRIILAHLGNGASLTAVKGGQPVDTTMAFTPAGGIPMGTRSGDLDPGLMAYFARVEHMSPDQFETMANFESGLLGMSETSADMQELLAHETEDSRASEAVAVFCYQIKKAIGAYTAAMGGLDQLVFAGGIGENAPVIRGRICNGLECLGIKIHTDQNTANAALISRADSIVKVRVMATDEERVIAESIVRLLDVYNPDK